MDKLQLSAYHKIFYYEWKINPFSSNYHIVFDQILSCQLDIEKLQNALNRFIADHLLLNSHVENIENELYWIRNETIEPLVCIQKLSSKKLYSNIAAPFDLEKGPLYRFKLIREKESYRFIIILHHIIIDGNAFDDFLSETSNYYNDPQYKTNISLEEQQKLIFETTLQLNTQLKSIEHQSHLSWHNYLTNIEHIDRRFIKLNSAEKTEKEKTSHLSFTLDYITTSRLSILKEKYNVSGYLFGQIVFAILLNRYTSQEKIAISYPITIKEHKDLIYGAGINTQIAIHTINEKTNFIDLIKQAHQWIQKAKTQKLSYYPIYHILEGLNKNIVNVTFAQTSLKKTPLQFKGVKTIDIKHEFNIDLLTGIIFESEIKDGIFHFQIRYHEKEFDKNILKHFIKHYKYLFLTFLKVLEKSAGSKPVREYSILSPKEYQKIVYTWNNTKKEYPENKTIHQLFEDQAEKTPDHIALVYKNTRLTYFELNARSNQLANHIRQSCQISPDDLILLYLERTEDMIIAILAALKAGAAYVPIDINFPKERIREILTDTQAKVILTHDKYEKKIENLLKNSSFNLPTKPIAVDSKKLHEALMTLSTTNLHSLNGSNSKSLAYVLYTSGTTGVPNGVMAEHRSVINFIFSLPFSNEKILRATFTTPYTFDVSIFDIWSNLLYGHQLHIVSSEILQDTILMQNFIKRHNINKLYLPAALLKIHTPWLSNIVSIEQLLTGVEPLEYFYVNKLLNINQIINGYGPTETCVCSTFFKVKTPQQDSAIIPLGQPINNTQAYVLDKNLTILPIGAIGELYIGGAGVTRGYLNNPKLTDKNYIPNPFQTTEEKHENKNDRLYKTGDFVRLLSDGNIEYIGRSDSQVKIRGNRIELGEIENKLKNFPGIQQTIVLARNYDENRNNKYLVAYYIAEKPIDKTLLYGHLAAYLPSHMIPDFFIYLEKISLTSNGKIDTMALPVPEFKGNEHYVSPRNEQESLICKAFAKILAIEKAGIYDDFFKLGGNSLSAIKLTSILQSNFNIKVADIFNLRTPKNIAKTALYGKNSLEQTLSFVKDFYRDSSENPNPFNFLDGQLDDHMTFQFISLNDRFLKKGVRTILLTGATGYLGCNILNQVLKLTNYNIFLLIRPDDRHDPYRRINEAFTYYFNKSLDTVLNIRVFVVKGDIEKNKLGLSEEAYKNLANKIDSIIHAAALVKHYGDEDHFYSVNVQGTINLLELSRLTQLRDFHYISTLSVLNFAFAPDHNQYIYTENDSPENLEESHNIYNKTKLQGEREVINYRQYGIKSNIYRVGNLALISENFLAQKNVEENAFFNWLKYIFKIKSIPKEISTIEVSQADLTAKAIIKIFDKKQLSNAIYHVFNPHYINLTDFFINNPSYDIAIKSIDDFIDLIREDLSIDHSHDLILKFLLRQGWLDGYSTQNATTDQVLQLKTKAILKQLNFEWPPVTYADFNHYLSKLPLQNMISSKHYMETEET